MDVFNLVARLVLDSTAFDLGMSKAAMTAKQARATLGNGIKAGIAVAQGALAAGAAATVAFGATSVKTGMQFDKSMAQVAATMGKTVSDMENEVGTVDLAWGKFSGNLREYAREMGANTAFTATQAADALNYMALAGYDTQTAMSMLPNVLNLAAAGSMDLARASDMVTDTATAFGMVLEDGTVDIQRTTQMVDEMAKAASTGNTSVEQLGDAFLVVGGLAKNLNGGMVELKDGTMAETDGIQELEIALTAMANAGIKGSEAGTHMRNMLLKLSAPTDAGVEQLEALGVSVFDADGKMRSLKDIMGDMSVAMGNLTQEQKLQAISDLFNVRDVASAEALLSAVGQDWDKIGESILDAQGAAQKMADTQLDNLAGDVTKAKSALDDLKIAISDKVTPALRDLVKKGTKWIGDLKEAIDSGALEEKFRQLAPVIAGVAAAFVAFKVASTVANLFMLVKTATEGLTVAQVALNAVMAAGGPFVLVATAIAGLVAAFIVLWNTNEDFRNKVIEIWENVKTAFGNLVDGIKGFIDGAIQTFNNFVAMVSKAFSDLLSAVSTIWDGIKNAVEVAILLIVEIVKAAFQLITIPFRFIWENCKETIIKIWDAISTKISNVLNSIKEVILKVWNGIKSALQPIIDRISRLISSAWETIKNTVSNILNGIRTTASNVWTGISSTISGVVDGIRSKVSSVFESVKSTVGNIFDSIRSTATNVWESIKSAITGPIETAKETVRNAIESIKGFFNFSWSLPKLVLPHPYISGSFSLNPPSVPSFGIDWYRKAYDNPVMFTQPTVLATKNGLKGFGDGVGAEVVMSYNRLKEMARGSSNDEITINVYAAQGQDSREIAREVQKQFVLWEKQKKAAYA